MLNFQEVLISACSFFLLLSSTSLANPLKTWTKAIKFKKKGIVTINFKIKITFIKKRKGVDWFFII